MVNRRIGKRPPIRSPTEEPSTPGIALKACGEVKRAGSIGGRKAFAELGKSGAVVGSAVGSGKV